MNYYVLGGIRRRTSSWSASILTLVCWLSPYHHHHHHNHHQYSRTSFRSPPLSTRQYCADGKKDPQRNHFLKLHSFECWSVSRTFVHCWHHPSCLHVPHVMPHDSLKDTTSLSFVCWTATRGGSNQHQRHSNCYILLKKGTRTNLRNTHIFWISWHEDVIWHWLLRVAETVFGGNSEWKVPGTLVVSCRMMHFGLCVLACIEWCVTCLMKTSSVSGWVFGLRCKF